MTRHRHGLSLLELMIALVITAVIAGAIASMMGAVAVGVNSRRDGRTTMVRASAASARLEAYVGPSRCILDSSAAIPLTIWINDARESGTVHATEMRWLVHDTDAKSLVLCFVEFPADWTQVEKDLADREYALGANWSAALADYEGRGQIVEMPLIENVEAVSVLLPEIDPMDCSHLDLDLSFGTSGGSAVVTIGATIRVHEPPES